MSCSNNYRKNSIFRQKKGISSLQQNRSLRRVFMRIKKILFSLCFILPMSLQGQIQYKPQPSTERHELMTGFSIFTGSFEWKKDFFSNFPAFFIKYNLYFPEIESVLPSGYEKVFVPGLQIGSHFFKWLKGSEGENYNLCRTAYPIAYHLGLTAKMAYLEDIQAFVGGGLARSICRSQAEPRVSNDKRDLNHYLSYGFFLSFKLLDRSGVYSLDQDYGINDMGLRAECLHYDLMKKSRAFKYPLCDLGLQISF